jgi:hypothetical protein
MVGGLWCHSRTIKWFVSVISLTPVECQPEQWSLFQLMLIHTYNILTLTDCGARILHLYLTHCRHEHSNATVTYTNNNVPSPQNNTNNDTRHHNTNTNVITEFGRWSTSPFTCVDCHIVLKSKSWSEILSFIFASNVCLKSGKYSERSQTKRISTIEETLPLTLSPSFHSTVCVWLYNPQTKKTKFIFINPNTKQEILVHPFAFHLNVR